ncbi:MAG: helix-turn-helix domain-containing protein [Arenimonas sp.]
MNDNAYQETLFAEPVGLQLKHAREKRGMKASDASARLKLPADVIEALEREDWKKLGAPIYARSYLTSYLKLLDLPVSMVNDVSFDPAPASTMKLLSEKPVRRDIDKTLTTLGYFAITIVIVASIVMLIMHFQVPATRNESLPLDVQMQTQAVSPSTDVPQQSTAAQQVSDNANQAPVMASIAPMTPGTNAGGWEIRVNADSWIEIVGTDGRRIENGIVSSGTVKQYSAGQIASVTIGNADQVQILRNGQPVDFSIFKQDNVARFNIMADGSLVAKSAAQ